jgi:hypothetical protein
VQQPEAVKQAYPLKQTGPASVKDVVGGKADVESHAFQRMEQTGRRAEERIAAIGRLVGELAAKPADSEVSRVEPGSDEGEDRVEIELLRTLVPSRVYVLAVEEHIAAEGEGDRARAASGWLRRARPASDDNRQEDE